MAADFDAEDRTFGQIFKEDHPYRVPQYQRPYTWDEDEFVEYWEDLIGSADTDFIGALIFNYEYVKDERYIDIIDGQQRLITTTIFAAVLRDVAKTLDKEGGRLAELIQDAFIAFRDIRGPP